ncbi:MAG: helix-turn-helix transcriptional regulator [Oscillospiraceae bacterium]|nr:helix-turn-helix transcriptional regulator [Oscillospiraceae bacterium]
MKLFLDKRGGDHYNDRREVIVMNDFSRHVGGRIRYYRRAKGWTLEEFAAMIGKSKATVSKYENGAVILDTETLYAVSRVLDVQLKYLTDYEVESAPLSSGGYFDRSTAYMYYYDGRVDRLIRSLLRFAPSTRAGHIDATLYVGIRSAEDPMSCQHLFTGELLPYDTITHMVLTNQINPAERMYICMLNPMQNHTPAVGMLSGIGSTPFFAPIAIKALIAKEPLEENDALQQIIRLQERDLALVKQYNMRVINRPSSLSLSDRP